MSFQAARARFAMEVLGKRLLNSSCVYLRPQTTSLKLFRRSHNGPKMSYIHRASADNYQGITIGQALLRAAEKYSTREAIVSLHQNIRKTFEELQQDVDRLAASFLATGLQRGDRIGMWGPNSYEWVLTMFAAARAGLVLVTINPSYQPKETEYCLNKVQAKAIVAPEGFKTQNYYKLLTEIAPEIPTSRPGNLECKRIPGLKSVYIIDDKVYPGTYRFSDMLEIGSKDATDKLNDIQKHLSIDDPTNIQFTSGTTGKPKGVVLTHHNLVNNAFFYGRRLQYDQQIHRACVPVPLYHCLGCVVGSLCSLTHGVTQVYPSAGFRARAAVKAVETEKCTVIYGTPTMFADMLNLPDLSTYDTSSLQTGMMTGAPCPEELMKKVNDVLGAKEIVVGYGLTETSPVVFLGHKTDSLLHRTTTVGVPTDHIEVKVVDNEGNMVPRGTPGELLVRGYAVMKGYWEDEDKTKEAITEDNWFRTGDTFMITEDGFGAVVGRIKDMIIRGGENIYPREVEEFLYTNPEIAEVQLCGVPDARLGEELCAWIKLKSGSQLTEEGVKKFCSGKIAKYKIPKYVIFVEDYPKTHSGKIEKYKMTQESIQLLGLDFRKSS